MQRSGNKNMPCHSDPARRLARKASQGIHRLLSGKCLFEFECARVQLIIFAFQGDKLLVVTLLNHVPVV